MKRSTGFVVNIPPLHPGESVLGFLMSIACASGHTSLSGVARELLGLPQVVPPWALPSRLDQFSEKLGNIVPDPEQLIASHTIFDAASAFVDSQDRSRARRLMVISARGRPDNILGLVGGPGRPAGRLLVCPDCVKEDQATYGWPYWRSIHQWPGLAVCPTHMRGLLDACGQCQDSSVKSTRARLPLARCWCGRARESALDAATTHVHVAIAGVLNDIGLLPAFVVNQPKRIAVFYRLGAERAGFGAGQHLAVRDLTKAFESRYGREVLWKMYLGAERQSWFGNAFRGALPPRSAVLNALLIHFLFENVEAFSAFARSKLEYVRALEQERTANAHAPKLRPRDHHPARPLQGNLPWDSLGPQYERGERLVNSKKVSTRHTVLGFQEEQLCDAVANRYKALLQEDVRPVRITGRVLLAGLPRSNTLLARRSPFVRLKSLVSQLTETTVEYRHRLAKWMVQYLEPTVGIDAAIVEASRATQLARTLVRGLVDNERTGRTT